jgi:hypothetical protein
MELPACRVRVTLSLFKGKLHNLACKERRVTPGGPGRLPKGTKNLPFFTYLSQSGLFAYWYLFINNLPGTGTLLLQLSGIASAKHDGFNT